MHRLVTVSLLGWVVWISPITGGRWEKIGTPFETKEACVEMLMAAARAEPEWLQEMQITCRQEGTTPNPPKTVPGHETGLGQGLCDVYA